MGELYQTPLEFASGSGSVEASAVTSIYNRVRFGNEELTAGDRNEIEDALRRLEKGTQP